MSCLVLRDDSKSDTISMEWYGEHDHFSAVTMFYIILESLKNINHFLLYSRSGWDHVLHIRGSRGLMDRALDL